MALAAWRAHRHPAIAQAVRRLGGGAGALPAPRVRDNDAFQRAWLAVAADDPSEVATGWLAATLDRVTPNPGWEATDGGVDRVARLRARCPDPRIADAALAVLSEGRRTRYDDASMARMYDPFRELLVEAATWPRPRPSTRWRASRPRGLVRRWMTVYLPATAASCASARWGGSADPLGRGAAAARRGDRRGGPAGRRLRRARRRRAAPRPGRRPAERRTRAGSCCRPARRSRRGGSAAPAVVSLVRAHRRTWPRRRPRRHLDERGLPARLPRRRLAQAHNSQASPKVWEAAAADPRLATFRTLVQGVGNKTHYLRFLLSEQARDLRRIDLPTRAILDAVIDGLPRPFEALAFAKQPLKGVLERVVEAAAFAGVDTLSVPDGLDLARLVKDLRACGLGERLVALEVRVPGGGHPGDGAIVPRLAWLGAALPSLQSLTIDALKDTVTFAREGDAWTLTCGVGAAVPDQGLGYCPAPEIPPEVTTIRAAPEVVAAVAAQHPGRTVVPKEAGQVRRSATA
ncbi:MAG: hypothetical protein R3F59_22335 [Myxococcota bacterium]